MATIYVRKTGNDSTGDGSTGTPYLTVDKALTVASAGDTIKIGDGIYQENSASLGYLRLSQTFASAVTIEAEGGRSSYVVIQGASSSTYTVRQTAATKINFNYIRFVALPGTVYAFTPNAGVASTFVFTECYFQEGNLANAYGVIFDSNNVAVTVSLTFTRCKFYHSYAGAGYCIGLVAGSNNTVNITLTNCEVDSFGTSGGGGVWADGVLTTMTISGGSFYTRTTTSQAVLFGRDASVGSGSGVTGSISDAVVVGVGHGLELGNKSTNVSVSDCTIVGLGDYAIVLKDNVSATVSNNTIYLDAGTAAMFVKGGTGNTITNNTIVSKAGHCITNYDAASGFDVANTTITGNELVARSTANAIRWETARNSTGNVLNSNLYRISGSGNVGTVLSSSSISSLSGLRSAWAGYGSGTNEAAATMPFTSGGGIIRTGMSGGF